MDDLLKARFTSKYRWIRFICMLFYGMINYVVQMLIWMIALVQFIIDLFVGKPNQNLLRLGEWLSYFVAHSFRYLTYNTEEKPFPFNASNKPSEES